MFSNNMKISSTIMSLRLLVIFTLILLPKFCLAADGPDEGLDETSSFTNAAQAQRAENVSATVFAALNAEEQAEVEAAMAALEDGDEDNDEGAEKTLAAHFGVRTEDIAAMRDEGLGWGQIAHELGVHPSTLGLGHNKSKEASFSQGKGADDEVAEATARNTKTGWSNNHGVGEGKSGVKGLGLSSAKASGKAKTSGGPGNDKSAAGGKSDGKGGNNGGGHGGGGNSGGNGGGNGGGSGK